MDLMVWSGWVARGWILFFVVVVVVLFLLFWLFFRSFFSDRDSRKAHWFGRDFLLAYILLLLSVSERR
jgi:hypothetical protein